jgi:uncharacterized protein YheU (UPF0270 family)
MPTADDPDENRAAEEPLEVPAAELTADALRGLIEHFVLREGTEYGERDFTLEEKVAQVRLQIERREVRILFDPASESVNLVRRDD